MTAPLHPANHFEWRQVVEGRDANGHPQVVCDHCGEPVPCIDAILVHMDGPTHQQLCRATGHCWYAKRPVSELPAR